jgi:hypothetical protein
MKKNSNNFIKGKILCLIALFKNKLKKTVYVRLRNKSRIVVHITGDIHFSSSSFMDIREKSLNKINKRRVYGTNINYS